MNRMRRTQRLFETARNGLHLARSSGFMSAFGPLDLARIARDYAAAPRRGGLAIIHAHAIADPKATWMPDAYLLLGDGHRGHENDLAIRSYTKYLQIAPAGAPMRAEAANQIRLLGGTPPTQ